MEKMRISKNLTKKAVASDSAALMLGKEEGDKRRYRGQDLLADLAVCSDTELKEVLIATSMAADYLKTA